MSCTSAPLAAPVTAPEPVVETTAPRAVVDSSGRVPGGTLVYALESAANGFFPTESGCDVPCRQVLSAIADPLVTVDSTGRTVPFLLAAIEPADDYFTWRLTIRSGIKFHDGSALDAAALGDHIDRCRSSPLTSAWFAPISAIEAAGLTLTLHLDEPWLSFPEMLATHPCAFVVGGTGAHPIGTGPFAIDHPSASGDGLIAQRFDDYWRGSDGTGEGLPLLDQIEFTVQPSLADRQRLLEGDTISAFHSSTTPSDDQTTVRSTLGTDTYQLVFNTVAAAETPQPLGAVAVCRNALAASTRANQLGSTSGLVTTGPFGPDQLGHLDLEALPAPADPQGLVAECLGALGDAPEVTILTTSDPTAERLAARLKQQWDTSTQGQISVAIEIVDPSTLGQRAFAGDFDAVLWRNAGGIHPEASFPWWHSSASRPLNEASLNIGRFADPTIDASLKRLRVDALPLAQQLAAQEITRAFDREGWVLWLEWTEWSITAHEIVRDLTLAESPDGTGLSPLVAGAHFVSQIWCDNAQC